MKNFFTQALITIIILVVAYYLIDFLAHKI
jgi:hypothetical protein